MVSWKEAAESHDSVASEALVMPMRTGRPEAGLPPSETTRRFSSSNRPRSTRSDGSRLVSPDSITVTRRSICRTMISMCLSWIDTPCDAVHGLDLVHQVLLRPAHTEDPQDVLRVRAYRTVSVVADLDVLAVGDAADASASRPGTPGPRSRRRA